MRLYYLQLLIFITSFILSSTFSLNRKKDKGEKVKKQSKFKKFISTGNIRELPKVARLPTLLHAKSMEVPPQANFDPCSTSRTVCLNGGQCRNQDGMFFCQCPPTHYGKKCEILADMKRCEKHLCANGAVCVSSDEPRQVVDPSKSDSLKQRNSRTPTAAELNQLMISINYECVCAAGFVGPLCETSEKEIECSEDYCMGRGSGSIVNGACICDCHESYIGKRCETENPCSSFECFNSGKCAPKVDKQKGTVEAVCTCPKLNLLIGSITGEQCESINLNEQDKDNVLIPCKDRTDGRKRTYEKFEQTLRKALESKQYDDDIKTLESWRSGCLANGENGEVTKRCSNHKSLSEGWCIGTDRCEPRVTEFPSGHHILMPFCVCNDADEGRFCEYRRADECDPSREEAERGVRREDRCTDHNHGTCVDVQGQAKCDCRRGFVGEMCETYDPCAKNPCKHAECIPVPSETVLAQTGGWKETFRCLCEMEDEMVDATHCVYAGTGNCSSHNACNEGRCVTCTHEQEDDNMQLCTQSEMKDGFRCICKPGFLPPYCTQPADACYNNLCENGAMCVPTSKYDYECKCPAGTRGTVCEEIVDFCLAFGDIRCVHGGKCREDPSVLRGFSCDCPFNSKGRDCEIVIGLVHAWLLLVMDHYRWTMPLLSLLLTIIALTVAYFCCARSIKNTNSNSAHKPRPGKKSKNTRPIERKQLQGSDHPAVTTSSNQTRNSQSAEGGGGSTSASSNNNTSSHQTEGSLENAPSRPNLQPIPNTIVTM